MKKSLCLLFFVFLLSCNGEETETPIVLGPPLTAPEKEQKPVPEIILQEGSSKDFVFYITYPEFWNVEETNFITVNVDIAEKYNNILISWRNPFGEEITRSSSLYSNQIENLSSVHAYVTVIDTNNNSYVQRTKNITVIDNRKKNLEILFEITNSQIMAIAIPQLSSREDVYSTPSLYAIEQSISSPYEEDYMWMMRNFREVYEEDPEFYMEFEPEVVAFEPSNVLTYEWYINDEFIPINHYILEMKPEYRGKTIRLIVHGENWEIIEKIIEVE